MRDENPIQLNKLSVETDVLQIPPIKQHKKFMQQIRKNASN